MIHLRALALGTADPTRAAALHSALGARVTAADPGAAIVLLGGVAWTSTSPGVIWFRDGDGIPLYLVEARSATTKP